MSKKIEKLKNDITYYTEQINALEILLTCANEQVEKVGEETIIGHLQTKIENSLHDIKQLKQEAERKETLYYRFNRNAPIEVMYFEAWNKCFKTDELEQIQTDLEQFSTTPFLKTINSHSSDEGIVYASENIELEEAQVIWDCINEFVLNEDNDELNWGDLLFWDGTEITKK